MRNTYDNKMEKDELVIKISDELKMGITGNLELIDKDGKIESVGFTSGPEMDDIVKCW